MEWTNEKPTKPGWYWWRKDCGDGAEIVSVVNVGRTGCYFLKRVHVGLDMRMPTDQGQWSGPLEPPR